VNYYACSGYSGYSGYSAYSGYLNNCSSVSGFSGGFSGGAHPVYQTAPGPNTGQVDLTVRFFTSNSPF